MKNIFIILFALLFLTGCAQNLALLGPAYSVVKTGGIQHAIVGETINYGVKRNTGKNISEHAMSLLPDEYEILECDNTYSSGLQKIFFNKPEDLNCKEIQ
tara:strand:+ start:643 stop:942 length:300 start_codon:yes stop_codon:yes gene_type:complete